MEFLNNGIDFYNEHGVFMTFEENKDELVLNVKSLGYDLNNYIENNSLYIDQVVINTDELETAGIYDHEGIFVRLERSINKVNAKRVALDSLDKLFYGLDEKILRSEFLRLLSWLKKRKLP